MRPITRMRTLAALCALLMLLSSVPATAWVERPIDDPQGPPVVKPTEVGDPDTPYGGLPPVMRWSLEAAVMSNPYLRFLYGPLFRFSRTAAIGRNTPFVRR